LGDLSANLPEFFGFNGVRATKERGCYFIKNAKIHKTNSSPREIITRHELLKRLENAGFPYTDGIITATNGAPFITLGRDTFVMTRHNSGHEPDFAKLTDISLVLEFLAKFHIAARNLNVKEISAAPPLTDTFEKHIVAFNSVVKQINRRPRLSDFDVLVLKHANNFIAQATNAREILKASNYIALHKNACENQHICHNALKEETFSIYENSCFILRHEETSVDLQLADLASVLRRYARKSSRETPIKQLLTVYNNFSPLPQDAEKILFAQLTFPWPFFKIVSQYYSKKRNFIPAAITSRMTDILEENEVYNEYVNELKD
jgi:CotS family spore coat protein